MYDAMLFWLIIGALCALVLLLLVIIIVLATRRRYPPEPEICKPWMSPVDAYEENMANNHVTAGTTASKGFQNGVQDQGNGIPTLSGENMYLDRDVLRRATLANTSGDTEKGSGGTPGELPSLFFSMSGAEMNSYPETGPGRPRTTSDGRSSTSHLLQHDGNSLGGRSPSLDSRQGDRGKPDSYHGSSTGADSHSNFSDLRSVETIESVTPTAHL